MNSAGIVVDIKAQISGYQEQVDKIQAALNKLKINSNIGKELVQELGSIQKLINELNKNSNIRITTDSGIDRLTDKLTNVASRIQEIGTNMQSLTLEDLDFSKLSKGAQDTLKDIQDLRQTLNTNMTQGLQEKLQSAIDHGSKLGNILSQVKEGVKNIDVEGGRQLLKDAFEDANTRAHNTTNEIKELRAQVKQYESELQNLNASKFNNPDFNIIEQQNKLRDLEQVTGKRAQRDFLPSESFFNLLTKWENNIFKIKMNSADAEEQVKKFFNSLLQTNNLEQAKNSIIQFADSFEQLGAKKGELQKVFNLTELNSIAIVDPQKFEEARETLRSVVEKFGNEFKEGTTAKITSLLDQNELEDARKATIKALKDAYTSVTAETKTKRDALKEALENLGVKRTELGAQVKERSDISVANKNYEDIIRQLTDANNDLTKRLTALEEKFKEQTQEDLRGIHDTGIGAQEKGGNDLVLLAQNAEIYQKELDQVHAKEQLIGKIEGVVQRWFSIYAAVRMVGNAIRSVISTIQELDKTITEIAIVTDMTQDDLWSQMSSYTDMARQYAASISGVYRVSQLYYQQGLQQADVMKLTEQTLKMARISGLDYTEATDYMTNAIRSFKMEMTDAQRVVDVYSEIAASSATSTTELASAMSKTASSAEAVGSSFENTTAMMAVMIEATRESAENIGSALKSIISRYGEMTADPTKITDSEGEALSLNKVDKALQTVGISIHDAAGQFREFDDVITELAEKWDTIDNNTQRYIATVMAGNRQQSRFLALVSNGERLAELSEKAANSQDAATLQVLKTMDSIEAKTQQLQTSLQSLYTDTGIEKFYKGILDFANNIIKSFTEMPRLFNLPIIAIAKFGTQFYSLAKIVVGAFSVIKAGLTRASNESTLLLKVANGEQLNEAERDAAQRILIERRKQQGITEVQQEGERQRAASQRASNEAQVSEAEAAARRQQQAMRNFAAREFKKQQGFRAGGMIVSAVGLGASMWAGQLDADKDKGFKTGLTAAGAILQGAGTGFMVGGHAGIAIGALSALPGIIEAIGIASESTEKRINKLTNAIKETGDTKLQSKDALKTLADYKKRYDELYKVRNRDTESRKEWVDLNNEIVGKYPELLKYIDTEGNSIANMGKAYDELLAKKQEVYEEDFNNQVKAGVAAYSDLAYFANERIGFASNINTNTGFAKIPDLISGIFNQSEFAQTELGESWTYFNEHFNEYNDSLDGLATLIGDAALSMYNGSLYYDYTQERLFNYTKQLQDAFVNENWEAAGELINTMHQSTSILGKGVNEEDARILENVYIDIAKNLPEYRNRLSNYFTEIMPEYISSILYSKNPELNLNSNLVNKNLSNDLNNKWQEVLFQTISSMSVEELSDPEKGAALINKAWLNFQSESSSLATQYIDSFIEEHPNYKRDSNFAIAESIFDDFNQYSLEYLTNLSNDIKSYLGDEEYQGIIEEAQKTVKVLKAGMAELLSEGIENENIEYSQEVEDLATDFSRVIQRIPVELGDSYLNIVSNTLKSNNLTSGGKVSALKTLFAKRDEVLSSGIFDENQIAQIEKIFADSDITSLSGIYKLQKALSDLNIDVDFSDISNQIIPNFVIEYSGLKTKIQENLSNLDKAISNATKGMDSDTALKMANTLNISLDEFRIVNGKYYYDNISKILEVYEGIDNDLVSLINRSFEETEELLGSLKTREEEILGTPVFPSFKGPFYSESIGQTVTFDALEEFEQLTYVQNMLPEGSTMEQAQEVLNYYNQYYAEFLKKADEYNNNFWEYVIEQVGVEKADLETILGVEKYNANVSLLSNRRFKEFLDEMNQGASTESLIEDFLNENISVLLQFFPEYASTIISSVDGYRAELYEDIIKSIQNEGYIVSTATNDDFFKRLAKSKDAILEQVGENTYHFIGDSYQVLIDKVKNDTALTNDERDNLLKSIHTEQYKHNIYSSLSGIVDTFDSFSYDAAQAFAQSIHTTVEDLVTSGVFKVDSAGNLSSSYDEMRTELNEAILSGLITTEEFNKLRGKLEQYRVNIDSDNIIRSVISNRNNITAENISQLAIALNSNYDGIIRKLQLEQNDNGTYRMSLATLVNNFKDQMNDTILEYIASEIDNVISSITGLPGSQSKGFTNLTEMQKYVSELNKLGITQSDGSPLNLDVLFDYDETLRAYRLTTSGLIAQISGMQSQLAELTGEQKEVAEYLIADTTKQFAEQINPDELINTINTNQFKIASDTFKKSIEDYNTVLKVISENSGAVADLLDAEGLINNLVNGGADAVAAMQAIAKAQGKELTAEQAQTAWRAQVDKYLNTINTLVAQPGEIVDKTTADIIAMANGRVTELGNSGSYLVQTAADLYTAYKLLLNRMQSTGEATLADLNRVAGLMLDNRDGEQKVIDALGDAAGMTYSRFGEILAIAGVQLTESLVNEFESLGIIQGLGGNQMRITNFKAFANIMNWDANSEEYISAFKTYNDSLIEVNRKTEHNILEEVENITKAKAGNWINLTQLTSKLQKAYNQEIENAIQDNANGANIDLDTIGNPINTLNNELIKYSAYIDNGILKILDNADIVGIINTIEQVAQQYGDLIPAELAELADAVAEAIKNYANLISGGIKGSLSNVQANELQSFADTRGLGKLDFTKTKEGLKLSAESATTLYNTISKVDTLQGQLVFDELRSSLESSNEDLANISKTSATIIRVQKQLQENRAEIARLEKESGNETKINNIEKENRVLQDQLDLYNKIAIAQSSDSKSFNFMDRSLPDAMQGPINYWNSVGEAYKVMNESASSGYMDIQDFYNIVNEMTSLAELSGQHILFMGQEITGDLITSSNLIQQGFNALSNIDGEGVKIDLSQLAANLVDGSTEMGEGFDAAIKEMARSQIAMLDSMINMLEAVVAMQELGSIAGDDNIIQVDELFKFEGTDTLWSNDAQKVMDDIIKASEKNEDIKTAFDSLFISGHSLWEYITNEGKALNELGEEGREALAAVFTQFLLLSQSDDFDLDNIQLSVLELLQKLNLNNLLDSYSYDEQANISYIITPSLNAQVNWENWKDEDLKQLNEQVGNIGVETKEQAEALLRDYVKKPQDLSTKEIEYVLLLTNRIKINNGEDGGKPTYELDGQKLTEEQLKEKIEAAQKLNISLESLSYNTEGHLTTTMVINGTECNVEIEDDGIYYKFNGHTPIKADSIEEAYKKYSEAKHTVAHGRKVQNRHGIIDGGESSAEIEIKGKVNVSGQYDGEINLPEANATVDVLNIVKINAVRFGNNILNTIGSIFGIKNNDLTLGSASAAIQDLTINEIAKSHYDSSLKLTEDIATGEANVTNLTVGATNFVAGSALQTLQGMNFATTSTALSGVANAANRIGNASFSNFEDLSSQLSVIQDQVDTIWKTVQQFADKTFTVTLNTNNSGDNSDNGSNIANDVTTNYSANVNVDTTSAVFATNALNEACKVLSSNASILAAKFSVMAIPMASISKTNAGNKISAVSSAMLEIARSNAAGKVSSLASAMSNIPNVSYAVQRMANALSNIPSSKSMSVRFNYTVSRSNAKGNIANAKGTKDAKAKGTRRTLMGELGPELVVSNGRYYVVGQNGAEFVDLAADAIVFNHKQTKRLLSQGMIGSRGRPVTNETNAISFAKGTIPLLGPARSAITQLDDDNKYADTRERIVTKTTTEKIGSVSTTPRYYDMKLFSYAKGNMSGDAMASASQALAALKHIRAMWQSMLEASAKDLGALAGRGGKGGGGGGGGGSGAENEPNYYIHDLEIWYNLLRQIDKLEKDITYQESLQQKIESDRVANGKALYTSQKKELDYLSAEIAKQKQLSILQEKYYLKQVEEINNSPFSKIFTFNEEGLMQYNNSLDDFINEQTKNNSYYFKDGKLHIQGTSYVRDEEGNIVTDEAGNKQTANFDKLLDIPTSGLEFLALLNSTDEYGRPVYTAEELVEVLKAFNFGEYLQFDSSGKRIDESDENAAVTILQTFYDQIDSIREDTDSLHDGVEESREKLLELESKRNDILQKIIDNQLAVEQEVVNAIESREQAIIDNAQKERDALDEANKKFLDGLNEQLNRERQMYQNQQDESELIKMQRQLAILQRSGGSASQIRSLQDQINSKQKDMYFEAQQQQIDAIQEASDKEIERLDAQIDLMTETLEYQKAHGLLWEEVYQIMAQSPEQIRQFIMEYTPDFESNSALQVAEDIRDLDLKIQEWVAYREDAKKGTDPITADETHDWDTTKEAMGPMTAEEEVAAKAEFDKEMAETSDPNVAQSKAINKVEEIREESKPQEQQNQEENKVQEPAKTEEVAPAYQNISGQIFGQYYAHNAPNLDRSSRFKRNSSDPDDYIFGDSDRITSVNILGYKDDMYYISQNGVEGWISPKAFADSYVSSTRKALEAAKLAGTLRKYDKGGSIDFTGLAWVDGSTTEPETILSASNTEYLKNDILGGIKGLNNIVMNFRNAIQDLVSSNNNPFNAEQNEGINIEKVELTMQVNSIANDYDARQAGSQALNEIVKIARKSGTRGLSRR